jgi:hypothetical protein
MGRRCQFIFSYNKHGDEITEEVCVCRRTVRVCRIMDEGEDVELGTSVSLSAPSKPRQNTNMESYDNGEAVSRRKVHTFYLAEKHRSTR